VIWTANAFALLGLGSLLALVDILVRRFRYLGKTIAFSPAITSIRPYPAEEAIRRPPRCPQELTPPPDVRSTVKERG
jgi:hypothetical protein